MSTICRGFEMEDRKDSFGDMDLNPKIWIQYTSFLLYDCKQSPKR